MYIVQDDLVVNFINDEIKSNLIFIKFRIGMIMNGHNKPAKSSL